MSASAYVRFTLTVADAVYDRAVEVLAVLPTAGWQEDEADGSHALTFWLSAASLADPSVETALREVQELGRCRAAPESDDWERRWLDFHHPVQVGRVLVRPPWAAPREGTLDVVIDVGMAFGTGGHATTRQCLELLQSVEVGRLLDVGCGSGVLSIAGVRLGFAPVAAVDVDDKAVAAAAANALLNGTHVDLSLADGTADDTPLPAADVVVANIALKPVVALGRRLDPAAAPAAPDRADARPPRDVIVAGLLEDQVDEGKAAWPTFVEKDRRSDGEWVALWLQYRDTGIRVGGG